jgi:hypothetical protein
MSIAEKEEIEQFSDQVREKDDREKAWDIAEDYLFDQKLVFSPRIFEKKDYGEKLRKKYGFFRNVEEEGVQI